VLGVGEVVGVDFELGVDVCGEGVVFCELYCDLLGEFGGEVFVVVDFGEFFELFVGYFFELVLFFFE